MPKIKNIFLRSVMDKESDKAFIKQGLTRHVENLRFGTNEGHDGVGVNIKGTLEVGDETDANTDLKCVGAEYNESDNMIYYMLASTNGVISKVIEYNVLTEVTVRILEDNQSILNLKKDGFITGINEVDGLLIWSEWENNPRRINIERAKGYGLNGFTEEDIQLVIIPPYNKLKITPILADPLLDEENNIKEKFTYFSYRWRYLDGEWSIPAPFTNPAFLPLDFEYDYSAQSNKSMINSYNKVELEFEIGSERVTDIQLIFRESESNSEWIIEEFNKEKLGWTDGLPRTFVFDNNKTYKALSDNSIRNIANNVPLTNKAQTVIDGRLLLGNYKQFRDIKDDLGEDIEIDFSINLVSTPNFTIGDVDGIDDILLVVATHEINTNILTITAEELLGYFFVAGEPVTITTQNSGSYTVVSSVDNSLVLSKDTIPDPSFSGEELNARILVLSHELSPSLLPTPTAKSNRDYEIGVTYLDAPCRSTTILTSKTNTIFITNRKSANINVFDVILKHKPPAWAKYFRFHIKQNRKGYNQLIPSFFYEEGLFRWIKLEGADIDKIKEGDYLIVKSDTRGLKSRLTKVKVLEIKQQEKNFLQPLSAIDSIKEIAGIYYKILPEGFHIDLGDYDKYLLRLHSRSDIVAVPITAFSDYIAPAHFYGDTLNDLTSGGVYSGAENTRSRYSISITSDVVGDNRFDWEDGVNSGSNVVITAGVAQLLSNSVSITFVNNTGHSLSDEWYFTARAKIGSDGSKGAGFFRTTEQDTLVLDLESERIFIGDVIRIKYDEYNEADHFFEILHTSNGEYDNIEEWFHFENIYTKIEEQTDIPLNDIHFVRGNLILWGGGATVLLENFTYGAMTMVIESQGTQNNNYDHSVKVNSETEILTQNGTNNIIFETEPKEAPNDVFFEIGKTYKIENGYHISDSPNIPTDIDQASGIDLKVRLDWFNAFCYGNAVESYKIKDEFNRVGLDVGVRVLTNTKEDYVEIIRGEGIAWSDIYDTKKSFNGLSDFNLSLINFVKLDREEGAIQKLINKNGDLLIYQEDAIGIMPYNKNVIYDVQGGSAVGISTNILERNSYRAFADGRYGTRHPESIVAVGNRFYSVDDIRGVILRLSTDGVTPITQNLFESYFAQLMIDNRGTSMVGGYDPKSGEYLLNLNSIADTRSTQDDNTLAFKERSKGFPHFLTFKPDFMLYADNELYSWKNGKMYKHNVNPIRNNFYGVQYNSNIVFYANQEPSTSKTWKAISIEGSEAWLANIKTELTSRQIKEDSFTKIEDYWHSEIMGNTNVSNSNANSTFGLGSFKIIAGEISTSIKYPSLSVGDFISSVSLLFAPVQVTDITETKIILSDNSLNTAISFLIYSKNQNVDGSSIRGDVLEVDLTNSSTEKVELRAVNFEVDES